MLNARLTNIQREEAALDRGARIQAIQLQLQGQMRAHLAQAAHDYQTALAQNPAFVRQLQEGNQLNGYMGAIKSLLAGSVGSISFEEAVNGATPFHFAVYGDGTTPGALHGGSGATPGSTAAPSTGPGSSVSPGAVTPDAGSLASQSGGNFQSEDAAPAPSPPKIGAGYLSGQPGGNYQSEGGAPLVATAAPVTPRIAVPPPAPAGRPALINPDTGEVAAPGEGHVPTPFDRAAAFAPAPRTGALQPGQPFPPNEPGEQTIRVTAQRTSPPAPAAPGEDALAGLTRAAGPPPPAYTAPTAGPDYGKPLTDTSNSAVSEIGSLNPNLVPGTNQAIDRFNKLGHRFDTSALPLSPAEWGGFLGQGGQGIDALTQGEHTAVQTVESPPNSAATRLLQTREAEQAAATTKSITQQMPNVIRRLQSEADQLDAQAALLTKQTGLAPRETAAREKEAAAALIGAKARRTEADLLGQEQTYRHDVLPRVQNDLAGLAEARAHLYLTRADREREGWGGHLGGALVPFSVGANVGGGQSQQDYWVNVPAAKRLLLSPSAADRGLGWNALVGALRSQEKGKGDIHTPGAGTEWLDATAFPGARTILDNQEFRSLLNTGKIEDAQRQAQVQKLDKGFKFLFSGDYTAPPENGVSYPAPPPPPPPPPNWNKGSAFPPYGPASPLEKKLLNPPGTAVLGRP